MAEQQFSVQLTKVTDTYFPMIQRQLENHSIDMDEYAKRCVIAAIGSMNAVLDSKGINWGDPQLDKSDITQTLMSIALLKLNATANPREIFFNIRNIKTTKKDEHGKDIWKKQIEMGIEGDGNDALLANFGRGVREVRQIWYVRENDEFEYPEFNGLDMTPPRWKPKGTGGVVRVVYPIIKDNGAVEFHISEREDVLKNLIAHINNNLMNETFGICADRYKASQAEKDKIKAKKDEIIAKAKELGLEKALDDPLLQKYISPAWTDAHSRESMIVRKMRNNAIKKIPKDFGHGLIETTYNEVTDETAKEVRREIAERANRETIDIEAEPVEEPQERTRPQRRQEPDPESKPEAEQEQEAEQETETESVQEETEQASETEPGADGQMAIGDDFEQGFDAFQEQKKAGKRGPGF